MAAESLKKPESIKIAMLLSYLEPEDLPIFKTFTFDSNSETDVLEEVVKKFEAYCILPDRIHTTVPSEFEFPASRKTLHELESSSLEEMIGMMGRIG